MRAAAGTGIHFRGMPPSMTETSFFSRPRSAWAEVASGGLREWRHPREIVVPRYACVSDDFSRESRQGSHMQARFYAPWYGRFLSPDPARDQHFEDTQSWNIYSYVRNQPTMFGDPTGMEKPMSEQERRQQEEAQKATNTQGFHAGERQVANQIASTISKVMPKGVTVSGQAGGETGVGLGGASTNVQVGKVYFSGTPDSPLMKTAGYVSGTLDVGVAGANIASGARAANGESQGPFKSSEAAANGATVIGGQRSAGISFGLTNAGNREEFSGLSTQYSAGGNFGLKLGSMSFSINDAGIYHLQIGPPALGVGAGASASKTFTYTAVSREVPTLGPGMPL